MKMIKMACCLFLLSAFQTTYAQLVINGGTLFIGDNAVVAVQGDVTTNADILGNGKILLNGSAQQNVNLGGFSLNNLEVNNATGVVLTGNAKIGNNITFTNGKIKSGNFNMTLANPVTVTGAGAGKYIETNGTGEVRKLMTAAASFVLPVGSSANYMPLQYNLTGGTYGAGAYVAARMVSTVHPNKPIRASDYLPSYWKPSYSGITGATINAVGTYVDGAGITGDETLLNGIRYDGSNWSLTNNTINTASNTVTFNGVAATGSDLYAMNKFLLASAKVFLQGAFNGATMNDNLRALGLLPLTDPYRSAPYSSFYTQLNNPTPELAVAGVFADKGNNDNIVDWIFLELRNTSGTLIQTRSALVQKDGDIVEIDGINPVFFKNLDAANYVVTVRHRNHLGLSSDLTNFQKGLSVANPTAGDKYDFTTATDAQIYGTSTAYANSGAFKLMWGGNANSNSNTRYSGPSNDPGYLLSAVLSGNSSSVISNVYSSGDLNMNGNVRYTGPSNDHFFLLTTALGGNSSSVILQQIIP